MRASSASSCGQSLIRAQHDEDDPLNAPDIVPVPILPGSYFDNNSSSESISDVKGDESSDEEIENLLTSPRSSPDSAADSLASRVSLLSLTVA